uniref:Uncharacterized protein n=1 Tax=Cacopsylla melanoneura TaxID=428564 RepID=A0A8D8SZK3_9HEMI
MRTLGFRLKTKQMTSLKLEARPAVLGPNESKPCTSGRVTATMRTSMNPRGIGTARPPPPHRTEKPCVVWISTRLRTNASKPSRMRTRCRETSGFNRCEARDTPTRETRSETTAHP